MNLPKEFEEKMKTLLGSEYEEYTACYDEPRHYGLRVNTAKISVEDFLKIAPWPLEPVLLQVLREGKHERLPLVQHIDFLPLRLGKAVCLPHRISHKQGTRAEIDDTEQAQLPKTGLDVL